MQKKKIILIISIAIVIIVYHFNFTSHEFGNYDSLQEAVKKGIVYKDKTILNIQQGNNVEIVLSSAVVPIDYQAEI